MSSGVSQGAVSAEAAGALVAFYETGAFVRRRHIVLNRLRQLCESEQFPSLPDDLQQRIREIVAAAN